MEQLERRLVRQIERLNGRLSTLHHRRDRLSTWRFAVFLLGGIVAAGVFVKVGAWQWAVTSGLAALPFLWLVRLHRRVETAVRQHELWRGIKQSHLAKIRLDWDRLPPSDPVPPEMADHPFALDLDVVGSHSLHRLMDTAITMEGSGRLRDWLLAEHPPSADCLDKRQTAVRELRDLPRFRDKLRLQAALVNDGKSEKWHGRQLLDWLDSQEQSRSLRTALFALVPLSLLTIALFLLNMAGKIPAWWIGSWLLYALISIAQVYKAGAVLKEAFFLRDGVMQMTAVFRFLEQYPYKTDSALAALCQPFTGEKRPSASLRHIRQIVSAASLQINPIIWFWLNAAVPWDIFFAHRFNKVKQELGRHLPLWMDRWFDLEALSGLATFAYLNPQVTWPILSTVDTVFRAVQIGHPLIPATERVCNTYSVAELGRLDIITGSNMAGKSSFLRTIGINLAMAYAGGGVMADQLVTRPFRLYTSMRLNDSVTSGTSFFYAEVRRLRALLTALEEDQQPLFFLIDEIFRGTNNRERFVGSQAYARALLGKNGIGLIATHDLELAKLADGDDTVTNYHFRDEVENERLYFDYILHDGVCPTTNALKIMERAGLPITETGHGLRG